MLSGGSPSPSSAGLTERPRFHSMGAREGIARSAMHRHMRRLTWMHLGAAFLVGLSALPTQLGHPPGAPPLAQSDTLVGILLVLAAMNLLTIVPVRRAMMDSPRRVFALSADPEPLLRAHLLAQGVALGRTVALAFMGLAAWYISGAAGWFWAFESAAVLVLLGMWPRRQRVRALLGVPL